MARSRLVIPAANGAPPYGPESVSRRGGMSGYELNPINARPVVHASVLRSGTNRCFANLNRHTNVKNVTTKWAVP